MREKGLNVVRTWTFSIGKGNDWRVPERKRRMDGGGANLWWIRTRRKRSHDPALSYRFWKPTRGWSLDVYAISSLPASTSFIFRTVAARKYTGHWPANCPQGADLSTWVALACRALIRF